MSVDLKAAVLKNINELKRALAEKSSEVAQLEQELKRHKSILEVLAKANGDARPLTERKIGKGRRANLRAVLTRLPETFTSKDFVKQGSRTKKQPVYLRQTLSRWAREGKIKRLARGKYQKVKKDNVHHLAA